MNTHRLSPIITWTGLTLLTISLYWVVGTYPFVAYDDGFYILDNPKVTAGLSWAGLRWAVSTFHEANWHPLTWLSHQLDSSLFGLWAGGHHLTNLAIHIANTLLLCHLLFRLTDKPWRSAFVAALFAIHPLHVESVAWVAERKDLLCSLFVLLTLHAYYQYTKGTSGAYILALTAFVAALLAKPMAVTVPFLLLLLDFWPLSRINTSQWRHLCVEKIPFLIMAIASSVVTVIAQRSGGAIVSIQNADIPLRLANAVVSVARYLRRTIWPNDLAALYPFPLTIPPWQIATSAAIIVTLLLVAVAWRQRRPYLLFGLLWFMGMLVPVSGLIQVGQQGMADRYTYLPLIGVFVGLVWLAADLAADWRIRQSYLAIAGLIVLGACWLTTSTQLSYWRSSEILFRRALAVTSRNYVMHLNLGNEYKNTGRLNEAINEYLVAVGIMPLNPDTHCYLADGLHAAGRLDDAVVQYLVALRIKPTFAEAHNNLGATFYKQGKLIEAINQYTEALRLNPHDPIAQTNLRTTRAELAAGQQKQAEQKKLR
jgi:tetratricopeptide (TPR) repeat protein